jgi:hypothetical protein
VRFPVQLLQLVVQFLEPGREVEVIFFALEIWGRYPY